jgi:oligopeptide/dipeptide ABC transporter ATP-binding protein
MTEPLVAVQGLTKTFEAPAAVGTSTSLASRVGGFLEQTNVEETGIEEASVKEGVIRAVDDLDFNIQDGEILGLVGESGCGKSTVARCMLRLIEPDRGEIRFDARPILDLNGKDLKAFRQQAQMVFQDPMASLNPRFTVEKTLAEPLRVHNLPVNGSRNKRILELVEAVHLREDHLNRYPHQLSGGERQRTVIARALATNPRFLILDEPTSALDASARVRIIKLLLELKSRFDMTYLVISHDISIIRHLCDRVIVMYLGRAVEVARTAELIDTPRHPYTQALMSALPIPDPDHESPRIRLRGEVMDMPGIGSRCSLASRCHMAIEECSHTPQVLVQIAEDRWVACHRVSEGQI